MRLYQEELREVEENNRKRVTEHLSLKYSEDFILYSGITPSVDVPYYEFFFITDKFPGEYIRLIQTSDETFSDNYYGILKKKEYSEMLTGIITQYISDAKVFFNYAGRGFPEELTDNVPLKDAIAMEGRLFYSYVSIFTTDSSAAEKLEEACRKLGEEGLPNSVFLYIVDQEIYSELTSDNYKSFVTKNKMTPAATGTAAD